MPSLKLGDMTMEYTSKYKYVGETLNEKANLDAHILEIKGKVEAAYQTILTIAGNKQFRNIQMEAIWTMVETCIIHIITYAGETRNPTKKGKPELNRILDKIVKRILLVPTSTPREALYIETGTLDIEHTTMTNRLTVEKDSKQTQTA